jgi:uncharacterized RDD family membrane protein YckC
MVEHICLVLLALLATIRRYGQFFRERSQIMNEKYAGAGARFLAALIDFVVVVCLSTLLFLCCMKLMEALGKEIHSQQIIGGDLAVTAMVYMTYFTVLEGGKRQATLGMLHLKVTSLENARIGYASACGRAVLKLTLLLGFGGLGAVSIFFSDRKQAPYDFLLQTVVKKE